MKTLLISINNKIVQHQDPQSQTFLTTITKKNFPFLDPTEHLIEEISLQTCNNNNNNTMIIVQHYFLDFMCLLMVVRSAGQNPLYT